MTIANRYEGAHVVKRGDYYYLFGSATNCCAGPRTGYSVFVGRSTDPLGPYVDKQGNSFLAARVGGTPFLSMNGNKWVGPGHNTVFRDYAGKWWTMYHALNRFDSYFAGQTGITKRPAMLDPIAWVDGWPSVRAGKWASAKRMPAPAAQPGETTRYRPRLARVHVPGKRLASMEFNGTALGRRWSWVRRPDAAEYGVNNGTFRFRTQAADLHVDTNTASVLTVPAPRGRYMVEAKVKLDLPAEATCCFNYAQAGVLVYDNDDRYVKLVHVSIWETRQTEWAKEVARAPEGYPRYGNTVVGPPTDWTWLRIVKTHSRVGPGRDRERYRAYTSQDGKHWVRGGVWTHRMGTDARIGLVSMGREEAVEPFTAEFDYVRVSRVRSVPGVGQ